MAAKRAGTRRSQPSKNVPVLWSTADWARAVADLPVEGPLPDATVIVPHVRAAHALRRELLRLGRADRLAGTRFVSPFTAARETLEAAGVRFSTGEEALRPLRIRALLRQRPALRHFRPERLRDMPGWDEAFARAIDELEGAGWTPSDLLEAVDPRAADLGLLWQRIDAAAGTSWTAARVLREATARLPDAWPLRGPVLAAVTGHESAVHAAFLRALPRFVPAVLAARPLRDSHLQRLGALFGEPLAAALRGARPPDW
ncbi:MAG: PD-(D/E)XK nuclease family protein, partial [Myxococcales bacterium]|nr:PD-(D/E)XK nuclease family protein [Myxococcales bacterium]